MSLAERLSEYVRAAFSGIWVQSHEHDDAILEIAQVARENGWTLASWDIDRGLSINGQDANPNITPAASDPLSAVKALNSLGAPGGTTLLVLRNFHRFMGSAEIVQALDSAISQGKQAGKVVVVLSPVVQIPVELERLFAVVEHDLPGRDQLEADRPGDRHRARGTAGGRRPGHGPRCGVGADESRGRERFLAIPGTPWQGCPGDPLGTQDGMLKKSGLLTLHRGGETFSDLGGLDALKSIHQEGPDERSPWCWGTAPGRPSPGRAGYGEVGFRQGAGK